MWKTLVCLSVFVFYGNCKYHGQDFRDTSNEILIKKLNMPDPPDHTKLVAMARYVLHNCNWASVATLSTLPAIEGFPFSNVKSVVDGSLANSTGVPYFYMSPLDFTARDLSKDIRSTVLVSLEETKYCEFKKYDPEDPRCTRLMLSGLMKKVKKNTPEYTFAKDALFERHPEMAHFPADHDWFVAKLKIAQIAMVDWFGGARYVPVADYLRYNYTRDGHTRDGYTRDGYTRDGYTRDGYTRDGYTRDGYTRDGHTRDTPHALMNFDLAQI